MVGVQGKQVSKVYGLYGMLDYQALSVTSEVVYIDFTFKWMVSSFLLLLLLLLFWFCFYLFIYLFNNLAIEVTVRTRKTQFSALLPIWPLLLVEI